MESTVHQDDVGGKDLYALKAAYVRPSFRATIPTGSSVEASSFPLHSPASVLQRGTFGAGVGAQQPRLWEENVEESVATIAEDSQFAENWIYSRTVRIRKPNYDVEKIITCLKMHLAKEEEIQQVDISSQNEILVTLATEVIRNQLLYKTMMYDKEELCILPANELQKYVFLKKVPAEIPEETIRRELSKYGNILTFEAMHLRNHPGIKTATRRTLISLSKPLPNYLKIGQHKIYLFYSGQPLYCSNCDNSSHKPENYPEIICYNCKQKGHLRRNCTKKIQKDKKPENKEKVLEAEEGNDKTDKIEEIKISEQTKKAKILISLFPPCADCHHLPCKCSSDEYLKKRKNISNSGKEKEENKRRKGTETEKEIQKGNNKEEDC